MRGVGPIDEAGRLRLLGAGLAGAAFGVVLVMLVVSPWAGTTTGVLVGVGVPSGIVGAGIGVVLLLRTWRNEGGYDRFVTVQRWVADRRVPSEVPASMWVPLVQAEADRQGAGWGKIVLSGFWLVMTWSMRDQQAPLITLMLVVLWLGLATWSAVWVIPRSRAARAMLRQGVSTPE